MAKLTIITFCVGVMFLTGCRVPMNITISDHTNGLRVINVSQWGIGHRSFSIATDNKHATIIIDKELPKK